MSKIFVKILSVLAKKKKSSFKKKGKTVSIPTRVFKLRKRTSWKGPAHGVTHSVDEA